ncbi:MAG: EAL domain-containing protein [Clostridia bacterium]
MDLKESIFDLETVSIETDLMDLKEAAKLKTIISNLQLYENNPKELTEIMTAIFFDENVAYLLTRISQNQIFCRLFPEFYIKNEYGENVINCQQNSSYHKYGVFKHILTTIEAVGNPQMPIGDWQKKLLKWTMFLHDLGKPFVKTISENEIESFAGHDDKSVELSKEILNRFYFSDEEKKIILTLIKYHDKYINEGEITYDNLKFLANELENSKELFCLLIDVKDADSKSKSMEVYNKYKLVKTKYLEFVNTYFNFTDNQEILAGIKNKDYTDIDEANQINDTEITSSEMTSIVEGILDKKNIRFKFQPIIDVKEKAVYGYEVFTAVDYAKKVNILDIINHAKDMGRYDNIQQTMLISGIETFQNIRKKEADLMFVNSDIHSYDKYINKPRIYDMLDKSRVVIEFQNYDKNDISHIQEMFSTIHKNRGKIAIDNFGVGTLEIEDVNLLDIDYIIPDISLIKDIKKSDEKQNYLANLVTYALSKEIIIIVVGVEDRETMNVLKKIGIRYMQGYYFGKPYIGINEINTTIPSLVESSGDDMIL